MLDTTTTTNKYVYKDTAQIPKQFCESTWGLRFMKLSTKEMFHVRCNTYACPYCGKRKLYELRTALIEYFKQFEYVRMWTFTLRSDEHFTPPQHYAKMRQAWKYFLKELRRNKSLTYQQRNVQFVKVLELHKSGFVHFHAMFTEYIPQAIVQGLWEHAGQLALGVNTHVAQCFVVGKRSNPNEATNYVLKQAKANAAKAVSYVSKNMNLLGAKIRRWSRSSRVRFFKEKPKSNGEYVLLKYHSFKNFTCLSPAKELEQVPKNMAVSLWTELFEVQITCDFGTATEMFLKANPPPPFLCEIGD